jgi:hypothetical protein
MSDILIHCTDLPEQTFEAREPIVTEGGSDKRLFILIEGLVLVGIDDHLGRHRADLPPGVEHPGVADAIHPGAIDLEGRLVDMPSQDHGRLVLSDPFQQMAVTEVTLVYSSTATDLI